MTVNLQSSGYQMRAWASTRKKLKGRIKINLDKQHLLSGRVDKSEQLEDFSNIPFFRVLPSKIHYTQEIKFYFQIAADALNFDKCRWYTLSIAEHHKTILLSSFALWTTHLFHMSTWDLWKLWCLHFSVRGCKNYLMCFSFRHKK